MNDVVNFSNELWTKGHNQGIKNDNKSHNIVNDSFSQKRDGFVYTYRQRHHLLSRLKIGWMQSCGAVYMER